MKNFALLLLVFFLNTSVKTQTPNGTDSILSNCPCSTKDLLKAQKRAKYLWGNGWILKVKCHKKSYFFHTNKAYAVLGKYLARDKPFTTRSKIIFQNPASFGVSLGGGFTTYYRFSDNKWSAPMRPYQPKESLDKGVDW